MYPHPLPAPLPLRLPLLLTRREGVVLRPPRADNPCHKLALHVGIDVREADIDLDLRSHAVIPLYAYDAPPPISPRSPLYPAYISLYLAYISPTSRLYLP